MHTHTQTCTHAYTHTYTHAHAHTYIQSYTHTHQTCCNYLVKVIITILGSKCNVLQLQLVEKELITITITFKIDNIH